MKIAASETSPIPDMLPRRATKHTDVGSETKMLADWRHLKAYVLLGEPGSGKSSAFRQEYEANPNDSVLLTARDFVTIGPPESSEGKVLFIDGLDERRASSANTTGPLDDIRIKLKQLGNPRFRISCREADWITSDTTLLGAVAPDGLVQELHLEPLDSDEIISLLSLWTPKRLRNPHSFVEKSEQQHLSALLGNPLLLNLLVSAVKGDRWPSSRQETYLLACRQLIIERNPAHREARKSKFDIEEILDAAGSICALLLLSDHEAISVDATTNSIGEIAIDDIPHELARSSDQTYHALTTNLFIANGTTRTPRHRTISEFLAARYIGKAVENGLPITRALALMSGFDDRIVEPLRGLYAWLAVHCTQERSLLIERDPLAIVIYGDVYAFTTNEKQRILNALYKEAERYRWFRSENWESHPFGALATADMEEIFRRLLLENSQEPAHESLLDCICDAIQHGEKMPSLLPGLVRLVRNEKFGLGLRRSALDALLVCGGPGHMLVSKVLADIHLEKIKDPDDELLGHLLTARYPAHTSSNEILRYFHPRKEPNLIGRYYMFWTHDLLPKTPRADYAYLADQALSVGKRSSDFFHDESDIAKLLARLLPLALETNGEQVEIKQLYLWLISICDEHGMPALDDDDRQPIQAWLEGHPDRQKELFEFSILQQAPLVKENFREFWRSEGVLQRATPPTDWYQWLLHLASATEFELVARYCLTDAAHAAIGIWGTAKITIEEVEQWISEHSVKWSNADAWLQSAWSCELDDFRRTQYLRERRISAKRIEAREQRKRHYQPHLEALTQGLAPPGIQFKVAEAYLKRTHDVFSEIPEERVKELLVVDAPTAILVINGLSLTLGRPDLPSHQEIMELRESKRKIFSLQSICLLAANLLESSNPNFSLDWSNSLAQTMTAFLLLEDRNLPEWFVRLAEARHIVVSDVMLPYSLKRISDPYPRIVGLPEMRKDLRLSALAKSILPQLIAALPDHIADEQLSWLNRTLLPAALANLPGNTFDMLCIARRKNKKLNAGQRIAWLIAELQRGTAGASTRLESYIGKYRARVFLLSQTLEQLRSNSIFDSPNDAASIGVLIQMLATHTTPDRSREMRFSSYSIEKQAADQVRAFLRRLASAPDEEASSELIRLAALPSLKQWEFELTGARYEQVRVSRASKFRHASIEGVSNALSNRAPASARDMAALMIDQISLAAAHIRFDDTNSVYQFWRDSHDGLIPKIENNCRDTLLGLIRPRLLTKGVLLEKEAQAVGDKRADLQASAVINGERIVVPVELKKEDHPAIWTAWKDQLIDSYTTTPGAQGIGIYIALWFNYSPRRSAHGIRPRNAQEMAEIFTTEIPLENQRQFSGLVLDLSLASSNV